MKTTPNVAPQPKTTAQKIFRRIDEFLALYVFSRGDRIRYLRRLGTRIGEGCQILTSYDAFGTEPWLIEIGNRVTITLGVVFLTHDGASRLFRDQIPGGSRYGNRFGRILIQDNSFIGANSILLPGVKVGPNSIVGAGSVVNKDVPPNMVYAGVPAKPIMTLEEYIENYKSKMLPIQANDRQALREELTRYFWGEVR